MCPARPSLPERPATVSAFLALGSNLGDRLEHLRRAVALLRREDGVRVVRSSRVYETAPVGPPQPDYLNAVIEAEVESTLAARDLLRACLEVERTMGRVREERWGPRVIDVDVLTFDEERIDEPDLIVPHPRMHERAFVLVPLLELTADPMLPHGARLGDLRTADEAVWAVRAVAPPLPVAS
jgi:2-amino-4-hydroxy-6-hydroxymethyldihydropteridine diphosphokinase